MNKVENEHLKPYKNNFIIFLGEISVTVHILFQIEHTHIYINIYKYKYKYKYTSEN